MIDIAEKIMGKKADISFGTDREHQIIKQVISNFRLKSLGWEPNINFVDGMLKSYEWFMNNGEKFP
jgi:nucleoside-diphosphate-sugar epimerase